MVRTHIQLIQMINLTRVEATETCMMTKLNKKLYETHTTIKFHGETVAMTILAGLLQGLAGPSKFGKIHQCRTLQFIFYIDGTDPCSPGSLKVRNRII